MTDNTMLAQAIEGMLRADLEQPRPWDEPPALLGVYRHTFGYVLVDLDVPMGVWEQAHPVDALHGLAIVSLRHPRATAIMLQGVAVPGSGLMVGLALRYEAWMGEGLSEEDAARVDRGEVKIADIPTGQEVRSLSAIDADGVHYMGTLRRTTGSIDVHRTGEDEWLRAEGRLPVALTAAFAAFQRAQGVVWS